MRCTVLLFAAACLALAADPWSKVQELKGDTEVRIFKAHSSKPLIGKVEEVHTDSIIVGLKKEEISVAKEDIDRLDYRPIQGARHGTKTTHTTVGDPAASQGGPAPLQGRASAAPTTSSSSGYTFGSKPDFQTIYRRAPGQ